MSELQQANNAVLDAPEFPGRTQFPEGISEKRKEPRSPGNGEAEIRRDGSSLFHGRILNITPSGCFVRTPDHVHLNPCVVVEILLVVNGKVVSVAAETRFTSPKAGIGFRFLEADRAIQEILDTTISRA